MYDYTSINEQERLADLTKAANEYNKSLPPDSKEYWVVDGQNVRLKKIPREDIKNMVSVGRAMRI